MDNSMQQQMQMQMEAFAEALAKAPKNEKATFLKTIEKSSALTEQEFVILKSDLKEGKRAIRPFVIDVIFTLNGQNKIKIFDPALTEKVSIRNLSNAKLPKDVVFVPHTAQLLRGVAASASDLDVSNTNFTGIDAEPILTKGNLTLGVRGNKLFNKTSTSIFDTRGTTRATGSVELAESIVINGDVLLEGEIEILDSTNIDALSYGRFRLEGVAAMSIS
jgi:hypothetical protein